MPKRKKKKRPKMRIGSSKLVTIPAQRRRIKKDEKGRRAHRFGSLNPA